MKKTTLSAAAFVAAGALALAGCSSSGDADASASTSATGAAQAEDITLWLAGTDTPDTLIDYLKTTYNEENGGTLTVEQIGWSDLISSLTTALPDSANTPDVAEIGNTQAATFTNVGAFMDLTDMYDELGGDSLLQGFVEAGSVGDKVYALPYYFGSRMVFYRKDLYAAAGVSVPTTLEEYTQVNAAMKAAGVGGSYTAGQDWRSGISWIFANGGDIATYDGSTWTATLESPEAVKGMEMWQELFQTSSVASSTDNDSTAYQAINDGFLSGTPAASTLAPNWAYWSLGDLSQNDAGDTVATWNDDKFGAYALPGVDGGIAPVFAGGSNIGISATTTHPEGAKTLMRIIFSEAYQTMLAENGLGPANLDYADQYASVAAMGDIALEAAQSAKLTPAAPGWAAVEEASLMEQYFQAVAEGGDVASLAAEYDTKIDALING
ncbi:extracellular solute-binding protein [Demequina capsici]|uniref:Extracellular solute-binding protein n=1 Tax=Demequina capsici TaxID=3075620 RepID=A0AA96J8Z7_9MICO|nr:MULTISPECIES: extracellular solute-binding protein [unclassified Demequina]WNM23959.1 extracellular solute-binding protein [Demequina sp. OYTSA14]WNM26787.1 extracellular solute-binding protein [Demequina sp. PMTSA13]